jgi:hypothetical protein
MGVEGRQTTYVSADEKGNQIQNTVKHSAPLSMENPSVLLKLVQNEKFIENFSKRLAGWVQVPNSSGKVEWTHIGNPLLNSEGRAWLMNNLSSALDKSIMLSNYPESRIRPILETEFRGIAVHLSTHLKEYDLKLDDCRTVMLVMRRAIESSYRRSVNDKGARHVYGSIDENVQMAPQNQGKILGIIPRF